MSDRRRDEYPLILVTGAAGQIGHELVRELTPLGRVVAPGRDELDLRDAASIRATIRARRPNLVVNAAAYTAVDQAESESELCAMVNAHAPRIIAEEVARVGGAVVHYSTDYIFDGTKESAYVETDAPNPLSVYGATKLAGEQGIIDTGVPHLIFRTTWIYGPRGKNFLLTMLRLGHEREELRVVADQFGAPTWSRNVAIVTAFVLARLGTVGGSLTDAIGASGGIYNLTADGATTWYDFAKAIFESDPRRSEQRLRRLVPITTNEYPTPARRPSNSRLDNGKMQRTFGVFPSPWQDQLALVLGAL